MKLFGRKTKHTKRSSTRRYGTHTAWHTTTSLSPEEEQKLRRLQRDGIIVLIDQPNLETEMSKRMRRIHGSSWALSYGYLVDIIARKGHMSRERRKVLGAYIVTSKQHQIKRRHRPSRRYLERNKITLVRPTDESVGRHKRKTAVDATIARIMTQEFEGIEILRLKGMTPPKRTFCIVAGDFDYVDVVQQAREHGCDVELWFWTGSKTMAQGWYSERENCSSERCGGFAIKNLTRFREDLTRSWMDSYEAWSEYPYDSD